MFALFTYRLLPIMDLSNTVIVVTGASSGIGKAFAEALIAKGATVYGLARSMDTMQAIQEELGSAFKPIGCDVTDEQQVNDAFAQITDEAGRIDALLNNAGLGRFGPLKEAETNEWNLQVDTNLTGIFFCTRAVIPTMQDQNEASGFGGHIINIASVAGLVGNANISIYNATKFGVRGFSEALMKELRGDGIKVTCVYPGSIETNFFKGAGMKSSSNPMMPEDIASTVVHVLEAPDNYLISEVMMRPLRPKG
ncbi:MAG: SDR family NAD(P)-dependent oxidoreductase [Rhodothermales bacterium]